ncbi:MAG: aldo/keto reductase, partial [Rufibacter sp.]
NLVSVMLQYSLLDRRPEEQVLDLLSAHKIGVLARGTLAQGILAGKPAKNYLSYSQSEAEALAATLAQEASALKQKNHTIAACFVLDNPTITSAVMGIRTKEQLQDALAISQAGPIPQETMDKLKKVLSPNHYELHR